jgi:dolichyl-diphosphooligosaccharide--protein glycosyltransferase
VPDAILAGLLVGLALLLRCSNWNEMTADGLTWVFLDDPPYHLRRALMTLQEWPRVPTFDPFLNFPHGGHVTWPPGMAWLLAGVAKLLGARGPEDREIVEAIAIRVPPLVGALTVLVLFVGHRRELGRSAAFVVAAVLAILPAHVEYTVAGRFDHHMFEPLLSWLVLWAITRAATEDRPLRHVTWVSGGAVVLGLAMLVWPGLLLHLGLMVCAVLLTTALTLSKDGGHPSPGQRVARAGSWVFGAGALASLPAVVVSPWALDAVYYAPSPLHLAGLVAGAGACALLGFAPRGLRRRSPAVQLLVASLLPAALLFTVPPLRRGVLGGLRYAFSYDFSSFSTEAGTSFANTHGCWPLFLCTGAALVLLVWRRARGSRPNVPSTSSGPYPGSSLPLVGAALFLVPALTEVRWLATWAPFGATAVASVWQLGLRPLGRRCLPHHPGRWGVYCVITLVGLEAPALLDLLSLRLFTDPAQHSFALLLRRLRQLTPPASSEELSSTVRPSYGILADWGVGHAISYLGGRPTLANNFWGSPAHDRANREAFRLFLDPDCNEAARTMDRMHLRYVIMAYQSPLAFQRMARVAGIEGVAYYDREGRLLPRVSSVVLVRLGALDGESMIPRPVSPTMPAAGMSPPTPVRDRDWLPACGRFRLIAEVPAWDGNAAAQNRSAPGSAKLFEVVRGAEILSRTSPGSLVTIGLPLLTEGGREIRWFNAVRADSRGQVSLRVPYATDGSCPSSVSPCLVRPRAPHYQLRLGTRVLPVVVSARAVERGQRIVIRTPGDER